MKRTLWKRKPTKPLKRTKLRVVGKIGRANLEANKKIKVMLAGVERCEMRLLGCLDRMFLTNAHRHKRAWYKGDVELLSDYRQVVRACVNCHDRTEHDRELNDEVFLKLRGNEN